MVAFFDLWGIERHVHNAVQTVQLVADDREVGEL